MDIEIEKGKVYQNYTRNQKIIVTGITKDWVFYRELNNDLQSVKKFSCDPERFKRLYYRTK